MQRAKAQMLLCLLSLLVLSQLSGAQAKRSMTLIDMLDVPQVTDPQLSPDGKQIAFVSTKADWKANLRISHIWRVDLDGGNLIQLTNGTRGESSPRWSPDGTRIAFVARRTGEGGGDEGGQAWV